MPYDPGLNKIAAKYDSISGKFVRILEDDTYLVEIKHNLDVPYSKKESQQEQLKKLKESYINQKLVLVLGQEYQ